MSGIAGIMDHSTQSQQEHVMQLGAQISHRGSDTRSVLHTDIFSCILYGNNQHNKEQKVIQIDDWVFVFDAKMYEHSAQTLAERWCKDKLHALHSINGVFSFAAWHRTRAILYLVRSAEGSLPLYWTKQKEKIAFCSEMPPLTRLPWMSPRLAVEQLAEQLSFRYVHAPRTLLEDIYAIPAGHMLRITTKEQSLRRWYAPKWIASDAPPMPKAKLLSELEMLLKKSLARRFSRYPNAGILLSGGIDSTLLLHYAHQLGYQPHTYTVTLEGVRSEASFAARIAKICGSPNHEIQISKNEFIRAFEQASQVMGQPLPSPAGVVQYLLFKKLRGMVLFSGEGGDELFGGRSMPYLASRIQQAWYLSKLPYRLQDSLRRVAQRMGKRDIAARYEEFGMDRSIGASRIFLAPDRVDILYDTGLVRPGIRKNVLTPLYQELDSDPINEILHVWQRGWLVEDSLVRNDRMSQRFGVTMCYPILDRDVHHFSTLLPGRNKIHREYLEYVGKWPLRSLLKNVISKELLHRPKRSLLDPLNTWLLMDGKTFLQRQVESICEDLAHIFVRGQVRRLADEIRNGEYDAAPKLWTLIHFHLWWKQFLS